MQVFIADASGAMLACDPVANAVDAAQGLDVDMDQFARPLAFVAQHRGRGSSRASRFSPSRRSTMPIVERARPKDRAIAGPVMRWRRNCSIRDTEIQAADRLRVRCESLRGKDWVADECAREQV